MNIQNQSTRDSFRYKLINHDLVIFLYYNSSFGMNFSSYSHHFKTKYYINTHIYKILSSMRWLGTIITSSRLILMYHIHIHPPLSIWKYHRFYNYFLFSINKLKKGIKEATYKLYNNGNKLQLSEIISLQIKTQEVWYNSTKDNIIVQKNMVNIYI